MIEKWFFKSAKWYQFWLPQSGFFGGAIMFWIIMVLFFIIPAIVWR